METVDLPVTCPICGGLSISEFPVAVVIIGLTRWNNLNMYATCHPSSWSASPGELEGVRAFLGNEWFARRETEKQLRLASQTPPLPLDP